MGRTTSRNGSSVAPPDYAALVRAASSGDRSATERLLMKAQEVAYRFSLAACGHSHDAEDVMQDALLKTYQHVASIRRPGAFRTWLYRTIKNACLMRRRRGVSEPGHLLSLEELLPSSVDAPSDPGRDPAQTLEDSQLRRRIGKAFKGLPPVYRVVVFLREMEGLSTRETAGVLGISEANVKTRLRRAHLQMRKELSA